jgi:hypothetical protein
LSASSLKAHIVHDFGSGGILSKFDPRRHPRDTRGRFRDALNKLSVGDALELPDGVKVRRGESGKNAPVFKIETPGNAPNRTALNAAEAADEALLVSAQHEHPEALGGSKKHGSLPQALQRNRAVARRQQKKETAKQSKDITLGKPGAGGKTVVKKVEPTHSEANGTTRIVKKKVEVYHDGELAGTARLIQHRAPVYEKKHNVVAGYQNDIKQWEVTDAKGKVVTRSPSTQTEAVEALKPGGAETVAAAHDAEVADKKVEAQAKSTKAKVDQEANRDLVHEFIDRAKLHPDTKEEAKLAVDTHLALEKRLHRKAPPSDSPGRRTHAMSILASVRKNEHIASDKKLYRAVDESHNAVRRRLYTTKQRKHTFIDNATGKPRPLGDVPPATLEARIRAYKEIGEDKLSSRAKENLLALQEELDARRDTKKTTKKLHVAEKVQTQTANEKRIGETGISARELRRFTPDQLDRHEVKLKQGQRTQAKKRALQVVKAVRQREEKRQERKNVGVGSKIIGPPGFVSHDEIPDGTSVDFGPWFPARVTRPIYSMIKIGKGRRAKFEPKGSPKVLPESKIPLFARRRVWTDLKGKKHEAYELSHKQEEWGMPLHQMPAADAHGLIEAKDRTKSNAERQRELDSLAESGKTVAETGIEGRSPLDERTDEQASKSPLQVGTKVRAGYGEVGEIRSIFRKKGKWVAQIKSPGDLGTVFNTHPLSELEVFNSGKGNLGDSIKRNLALMPLAPDADAETVSTHRALRAELGMNPDLSVRGDAPTVEPSLFDKRAAAAEHGEIPKIDLTRVSQLKPAKGDLIREGGADTVAEVVGPGSAPGSYRVRNTANGAEYEMMGKIRIEAHKPSGATGDGITVTQAGQKKRYSVQFGSKTFTRTSREADYKFVSYKNGEVRWHQTREAADRRGGQIKGLTQGSEPTPTAEEQYGVVVNGKTYWGEDPIKARKAAEAAGEKLEGSIPLVRGVPPEGGATAPDPVVQRFENAQEIHRAAVERALAIGNLYSMQKRTDPSKLPAWQDKIKQYNITFPISDDAEKEATQARREANQNLAAARDELYIKLLQDRTAFDVKKLGHLDKRPYQVVAHENVRGHFGSNQFFRDTGVSLNLARYASEERARKVVADMHRDELARMTAKRSAAQTPDLPDPSSMSDEELTAAIENLQAQPLDDSMGPEAKQLRERLDAMMQVKLQRLVGEQGKPAVADSPYETPPISDYPRLIQMPHLNVGDSFSWSDGKDITDLVPVAKRVGITKVTLRKDGQTEAETGYPWWSVTATDRNGWSFNNSFEQDHDLASLEEYLLMPDMWHPPQGKA